MYDCFDGDGFVFDVDIDEHWRPGLQSVTDDQSAPITAWPQTFSTN